MAPLSEAAVRLPAAVSILSAHPVLSDKQIVTQSVQTCCHVRCSGCYTVVMSGGRSTSDDDPGMDGEQEATGWTHSDEIIYDDSDSSYAPPEARQARTSPVEESFAEDSRSDVSVEQQFDASVLQSAADTSLLSPSARGEGDRSRSSSPADSLHSATSSVVAARAHALLYSSSSVPPATAEVAEAGASPGNASGIAGASTSSSTTAARDAALDALRQHAKSYPRYGYPPKDGSLTESAEMGRAHMLLEAALEAAQDHSTNVGLHAALSLPPSMPVLPAQGARGNSADRLWDEMDALNTRRRRALPRDVAQGSSLAFPGISHDVLGEGDSTAGETTLRESMANLTSGIDYDQVPNVIEQLDPAFRWEDILDPRPSSSATASSAP